MARFLLSFIGAVFIGLVALSISSCSREEQKTSFVVAHNSSWEPLPLPSADQNLIGFSEDLMYEIAKLQSVHVTLVTSNYKPLTDLLDRGNFDGILTGIQPSSRMLENYSFSDPYFQVGPVIVIRADASFSSLDDLNSREVGYERGSPWPFQLASIANCFFRSYEDRMQAVEDLNRGLIDAVLLDPITAHKITTGLYSGKVKIAGPPVIALGVYLVVKKGSNEELIRLFNKGLKRIRKEGLYDKMLFYWGLYNAEKLPS